MSASKTAFRTAYNHDHERNVPFPEYATPSGRRMQDEYGYEIDKFGRKVLVKTGETDLYAKIQEELEETKIENILKRVAIGDTSVLRPDGIYADLTEMPGNLLEARQMMQELENTWNGLPNEIKKKYNYDVEQYIAAAGKEDWLRDMGLLEPEPEPKPETAKPVKEGGDE